MSARDLFYPEGKKFSDRDERLFSREELVYNVTEDILIAMEDLDVSKKELSERLGKSRSFITQTLNGSRNMTLGTLSDICFVLGIKPNIHIGIEPPLDNLKDIEWTAATMPALNDSVQVTENVIDCTNHPKWERAA